MLGTTAGELYWMFRYLERSENTARLIEAGQRIALTRPDDSTDEWSSIIKTAGVHDEFLARHDEVTGDRVIDFLLRDETNPSSVRSAIEAARTNARGSRTALTREVWEATNACWLQLSSALSRPVEQRAFNDLLEMIRRESAIVRGVLHGTMLRNDIYDFARLGTFIERADNTARILDVKYYVLLPSAMHVGSRLDNVQWETILRALAAQRSYHWQAGGQVSASGIAAFVILDKRMPRSLAFCYSKIVSNLRFLAQEYGDRRPSHDMADELLELVTARSISDIFDIGLHDVLGECIAMTHSLAAQIELDYRFTR